MSNPLMNQNDAFLGFINSISNPNLYVQQLLQKNPAAANFLQQMQKSGKSPQEIAQSLAQERGIDLNQVINKFRRN